MEKQKNKIESFQKKVTSLKKAEKSKIKGGFEVNGGAGFDIALLK